MRADVTTAAGATRAVPATVPVVVPAAVQTSLAPDLVPSAVLGQEPVARAAVELVARCDAELLAAQLATDPAERFLHAHLAALRLAGAMLLAVGARPPRGRPRSAWDRLTAAVPGCASWAAFFTAGVRVRAAIEAGDDVDDAFAGTWVAAAEDFRDVVCVRLGIDPFADLRSTMAWAS